MLFNSVDFAIFVPIVFILYWFLANRKLRYQNILLVLASYFFYGCWDWRFLSLIILSTTIDFFIGLGIKNVNTSRKKKTLLLVSLITNLGLLGVFKYYNFFIDNFIAVFSYFGNEIPFSTLKIILPVGISFYTFQTLSYTIDVYRGKLIPTRDYISFAAFVSFFPQLVAGPIERATNLLPQFQNHRRFDYSKAADGLRQILWGLFKKIVIADNCAQYANDIFNNSADYSGSTLVIGAIFFTFQIYGDFSGYSDIAIGTARLFGFNLMQNFAFPYFSRSIAEFWRRWHISLSTWFRDYLYIPLGGSRGNNYQKTRNVFVIFLVSGFWHGANWTFVAWGALNAIYFLPLLLLGRNRIHQGTIEAKGIWSKIKVAFQISFTFTLCVFAWIFFRAESMAHAIQYISEIFSPTLFSIPEVRPKTLAILIFIFVITEWLGKNGKYALMQIAKKLPKATRWVLYIAILFCIFYFNGQQQQFIYFQF